jgi:hypothetical protein
MLQNQRQDALASEFLCFNHDAVTMLAADQGQRSLMINYIEVHAPARSRDLAYIGVSGTAIVRAVADGVVVRIGGDCTSCPTASQTFMRG